MVVPPLSDTDGDALTVTVTVAVDVQPLPAVTVYDVVLPGATVMLAVVAPVLHKYGAPPLAVNVVPCPAQIVASPAMFTTGGVDTITVATCVEEQVEALVAVTV